MHTARAHTVAIIPVVLTLIAGCISSTVLFLAASHNVLWLIGFLVPAVIVLAAHLLFLGMWQRVSAWRVRRHVNSALIRGDSESLRQAAAETAEAERDWPGSDLWVLRKALEITRHRVERAG
jgi:cytochrome c-type biogenesis protein CcmH/NrfG